MDGDDDEFGGMPTLDAGIDIPEMRPEPITLNADLSTPRDDTGAPRAPGNSAQRQQQQQQQQSRQMQPEEYKHFLCIYPSYVDAALSVSEGRRLPKNKLVGCENVSLEDVVNAFLTFMGENRLRFAAVVEQSKRHPSSWWDRPGRLRLELKTKEGQATTTWTKEQVMEEIAKRIPALPSRAQRLAAFEERKRLIEEARKKRGPAKAPGKKEAAKIKGKK